MALVEIYLNRDDALYTECVVVGDGNVPGCKPGDLRFPRYGRGHDSPMLSVNYKSKERTICNSITIHPDYAEHGWETMRDLYQKDPEKREFWIDWEDYCKAVARNPLGMADKPFPDELLPTRVLELRALGKKTQAERTEWEAPSLKAKRFAEESAKPATEKPSGATNRRSK